MVAGDLAPQTPHEETRVFEADDVLVYTIEDGTAWLRLNRPDQLNACSAELYGKVKMALRLAEADDAVDTIVLTGTGRAFCSGGDLKTFLDRITSGDPMEWWEMHDSVPLDTLRNVRKPTICAINGICLAAGNAFAVLSDISIAVDSATFGFPEVRNGFAESHAPRLMFGRVSFSKMKYYLLTGRRMSATEAERIGMITEVVPDDKLIERVNEVIAELRETSLEAKQLYKEFTNRLVPQLDWVDLYRGIETKEMVSYLEAFADGTRKKI